MRKNIFNGRDLNGSGQPVCGQVGLDPIGEPLLLTSVDVHRLKISLQIDFEFGLCV